MHIKKLVGTKCYLSPMSGEDALQYATWLNDLTVTRNLAQAGANVSYENELEAISRLGKSHNYAIVDLSTDRLIGACGLADIDASHGTAMLGIFIGDQAHRGIGYGSEALHLLIDYAFQYLNLENIMLKVYSFNPGAVRCYEKLGFKHMGTRRRSVYRERARHDEIYMDLLPEDFYR